MSAQQASEAQKFDLENFEHLAYTRQREAAAREMIHLFVQIDSRYGGLDTVATSQVAPDAVSVPDLILARIASALSCLLADPELNLSSTGVEQLMPLQRWLAALFAASPFGNADHILRTLNLDRSQQSMQLAPEAMFKFCLLYAPDSEIVMDVDVAWAHDRRLAVALALALLSPRFLGTPAAHGKREALLGWLPGKLAQLDSLAGLPAAVLHDAYMHCSYADRPDKHEIKREINRLVRKEVMDRNWTDLDLAQSGTKRVNGKPVLLVVLEWFSIAHSIYRTHSASMRGLRERFHVIGAGRSECVDDAGRAVFDEFIDLGAEFTETVERVRALAAEHQPGLIYYPAIGMFPLTIFLSNMRLAPVQVTALGHGATTMSPFIDYYAVEEDISGDPATFSEQLLSLPVDAMPHVRSGAYVPVVPQIREMPQEVRIVVPATPMKLNPRLIAACQAIAVRARTPVRFDFFCGASGLGETQVRKFINRYGLRATVHGMRPYGDYLGISSQCDLFLCPFPYGNMNGIVDMAQLGMAGVCRTGPQIHEHIDEGLFGRLGLPGWLVAATDEAYVEAAVRLIDNHAERVAIRRDMLARNAVQIVFDGRVDVLGEKFEQILALRQGLFSGC